MIYKPYGRTGKKLSAIGFGGMRFDKPEKIDVNAELLLHAHAHGINYFDTAPGYCSDKSEDIFGAAFRHMRRESFYCSTKCMAADGAQVRSSLERSLKRLHVEKIDFFHIWCLVNPGQWNERVRGGAVATALKAKAEGLVGHVAASVHLSGSQTVQLITEGVLEGLTLPYNIMNFPFRQEALAAAGKAELGVVTMNPLGGGMIPSNAERLAFLKGPDDADVVQAALRFNISHPAVTCALVGFSKKEHIDQAVSATDNFKPHTAERIELLKSQVGKDMEGFCTMCGYCLPCPIDMELPKLMESYNYKVWGQGAKGIKDRLAWHWCISPDAAAACLDCGQCERRCTQHLFIRERLKEIAKLAK